MRPWFTCTQMSCLPMALIKQRRHHGRVHAAGQRQQHLLVADLGADGLHLLVDERVRQLGRGDSLHVVGTLVRIHPSSFRCYERMRGARCVCLLVSAASGLAAQLNGMCVLYRLHDEGSEETEGKCNDIHTLCAMAAEEATLPCRSRSECSSDTVISRPSRMQRSHPRRGASPSTFLISSQMVDPTRVRKFSTSLRAHTYVSCTCWWGRLSRCCMQAL